MVFIQVRFQEEQTLTLQQVPSVKCSWVLPQAGQAPSLAKSKRKRKKRKSQTIVGLISVWMYALAMGGGLCLVSDTGLEEKEPYNGTANQKGEQVVVLVSFPPVGMTGLSQSVYTVAFVYLLTSL